MAVADGRSAIMAEDYLGAFRVSTHSGAEARLLMRGRIHEFARAIPSLEPTASAHREARSQGGAPLREFVYLDEVSVFSLISSRLGQSRQSSPPQSPRP